MYKVLTLGILLILLSGCSYRILSTSDYCHTDLKIGGALYCVEYKKSEPSNACVKPWKGGIC